MNIITRRQFIKQMSQAALGVASLPFILNSDLSRAEISKADKLNFVFFLVDDWGWTDAGLLGSKFYETPNIDSIANKGMKFTNGYAACPVCSPTRASILTGKYPARLHVTDWISGHKYDYARLKVPDWTQHLPLEEVNIAEALKPAGYVSASIGKWHLGDEKYYPEFQGFDLNIAGTYLGSPPSYFYPYKRDSLNISTLHGGKEGEYLTDRLTDEAEVFIEKNKDKPFFLYLAHYAVHMPLQAKQAMIEKYKLKVDPNYLHNNPTYAAMIQSVDESVGRITKKLNELKIAERTVFIIMSDNGGVAFENRHVTSNRPLREGKGTAYEGGVRVPFIISWHGVVKPGSTCDIPVSSVDFYPTILETAQFKDMPNHNVDGVSLVPLLKQTGTINRDVLYWHYPHYHPFGATPYGAIRKGDFKLIEFYEDNHIELYNLKEDVGESINLAVKMTEKANELRLMLHNWRKSVNAQMPSPNPNYDATKAKLYDGQWLRNIMQK